MAAVQEIEEIVSDASRFGNLEQSKRRILQEYFDDLERRVRRLYDGALAITSQRYKRENIVNVWREFAQ